MAEIEPQHIQQFPRLARCSFATLHARPAVRRTCAVLAALATSACAAFGQTPCPEPAQQLVREVVYNELHDHVGHGYWRYWTQQSLPNGKQTVEVVETPAGPLTRVVLKNGQPLDPENLQTEQAKLEELAASPSAMENHRQAFEDDQQRIGRIMTLLPDAFLFEDIGTSDGMRHLRFRPNPNYSTHTIESRVFHALSGDMWIDTRMKRLWKIEGRVEDDVTFGFGLLGKVNKGSWFRMQRRQVSPTEWKTEQLDVHISGRAIVFKTISHETSEIRGGFTPLPRDITVAQSVHLLEETAPEVLGAELSPVALGRGQ